MPAVTAGFAAQGLAVRELPIRDTGLREARILLSALRELGSDVVLAEKPQPKQSDRLVIFFQLAEGSGKSPQRVAYFAGGFIH